MTVPVLTEENKVSLVVKGDDAAAAVVGVSVEEAGQHATHTVTQASVEVVEDHLRPMAGHLVCPLRHSSHSTSTTAQHPQFKKQNTSTRYKQHHNTDALSLSLTHTRLPLPNCEKEETNPWVQNEQYGSIYRLTERLSACVTISTCRRVSKVGLEKCVKKLGSDMQWMHISYISPTLLSFHQIFPKPEAEVSDQLRNPDLQPPA